MSFLVAIVGRPNVGKSTLFNRITRGRTAIVDETSGVTRDRHYARAEWQGKSFTLVDTGGYVDNSDDVFEKEIRSQVEAAVEEADAILFMVDVTCGISSMDAAVAGLLRKGGKKVLLTVNKVDNEKRFADASEFYRLGLGDPYCISSINGFGTGDLLDELAKCIPAEVQKAALQIPRLAIIGRPNVGKSSMVNLLLGEERCIVTPVPGTTRAPVDTHFKKFGHEYHLVDTAGLRKKRQVHGDIEFYSMVRTLRAIEDSDVCILLLDATEGFTGQDTYILSQVEHAMKGLVVAVNKWDLVVKERETHKDYANHIRNRMAPFTDVPVIYTSVIKKQRVLDVLKEAGKVYNRLFQWLDTEELNEIMMGIIKKYPPPSVKGKLVHIFSCEQYTEKPQHFIFRCNMQRYEPESYLRFLENKIRENFEFTGVPLKLYFKRK